MVSVVDTSVKHFHSGMLSAPTLNGVAGSMIGLLNACLVTGFEDKFATSLNVVGGVATLTFAGTNSAAVDSVILVSGSSFTALNGEQKITSVGSGFVTFATAAANGSSGPDVTFKMAPAGWLKPFAGTNVATYKSADPASTGMILRVDDTGTVNVRVVGYEQMTSVGVGTGRFPTTAQMSGGGYWSKSDAANSGANAWALFADSRKFILYVAPYFSTGGGEHFGGYTRGFGDDLPFRPGGDPYACSLSYSINSDFSIQYDGSLDISNELQQAMPRGYTGLGSGVLYAALPYTGTSYLASGLDTVMFGDFPPLDGGLRLSRKYLALPTLANFPRCDIPGILHVPHSTCFPTFKFMDTISGTGALAGRKLFALNPQQSPQSAMADYATGVSFVDITGPWR